MSLDVKPVRSNETECRVLYARLQGNGTGNATVLDGKEVIASAARLSAGRYSVTMRTPNVGQFKSVRLQHANDAPTAGTARVLQYDQGSYTVTGGVATFEFYVADVATPTLQDLATTDQVYLELVFGTV